METRDYLPGFSSISLAIATCIILYKMEQIVQPIKYLVIQQSFCNGVKCKLWQRKSMDVIFPLSAHEAILLFIEFTPNPKVVSK